MTEVKRDVLSLFEGIESMEMKKLQNRSYL